MAKYLFGFSMNRSAEDSSNDCVFRLFDETALMLEWAILQGYKSVKFQYGMDETNLSKQYSAIIKDYNLEFTGAGNTILDLQVTVGADTSSDESVEYSGNPGEAFLTVCEEEEWVVGKYTETKDTEKESLLRTGQTATDFIKNVLVPDSVSLDGANDYYFWTDTDETTGKTLANFTPKGNLESSETTDYKVYEIVIGGGDGNEGLQCEGVISFEPSFNGLFYNFFNEEGTAGLMASQNTAINQQGTTSNITAGTLSTQDEFSKAVFVGDSLFVGMKQNVSGINVLATGGEAVHQGMERYTDQIIATQAPVVIIEYGVNDAGHNNTDLFIRKYTQFINDIKAGIPNVKIYVNKIFPGDMSIATNSIVRACLEHVDEYNQALNTIVQNTGVGYIDPTVIPNYKSYYSSDGIHFKGDFYQLWYDEMKRQVTGASTSAIAASYASPMVEGPDTNKQLDKYVWAIKDCGLYKGTSRDTLMLAKVFKGRRLTVIDETPAWYHVQYTEGLSGYILKSSLSTTSEGLGLNDTHNSSDITNTVGDSSSDTSSSTTSSDTSSLVTNAISNGGISNPAYIMEVPTIDELTNEVIDPYTNNGIKRRVGSSTYNSEEMGRVAEYLWSKSQALANTAQLTLRGDASITTMSFCAIVVLTPDGFFHHSSGLYQVLEISDDIDGGEYTTTLNLVKLGLNINEDGSIAVRDTSEMVFPVGTGTSGVASGTPGTTNGGSALTAGGGIEESTLRSVLDVYNGAGYSQSNRTGTTHYDCSSLVNAVMGDLGISVNWGTTAVGVEKIGSGQWGTVIWSKDSGQTLTKDMIPSGAVFCYNNGSHGHTGIFVNSEQMFHASNPTKGVLYGSTDYYVDYLNKYSGKAYVVVPPASTGSPVKNNGIKSRIN